MYLTRCGTTRVVCEIVETKATCTPWKMERADMHVRRDGWCGCNMGEQVRPRLEACQPLAETFGAHEDLLVWRTRGVLRA